jgi:hypothetical protein
VKWNFFHLELQKFHILTQIANLQAKMSKRLYTKESKQRKETEEALAKEKENIEKMKKQRDEITEELRIALDKKPLLENQIAETDQMVKGLELRITSSLGLMERYKKESDEMKIQCGNALKEAQALRSKQGEVLSTYMPHFFSDFSYSEIKEATQNFDPSLKIGEGRYRSIYKGLLRHTQVAIKMLHHHSLQAPIEFQHEVGWFQ